MFGLFQVGPGEIVLVLVIVLVIFGPGKLPQMGKALGESIRNFKASATKSGDENKPEDADDK